ncbi:hypothetical protein PsYK624_101300 [Phanerochaete sordida]|uniref:Nephrocystin 3-like N-terminal domain-containing protein n=1 Tax=Phanerochaete sordida TaxID=48140 RepID=A0A9P3GD89_9APHY|nr:hypothetical protein PsYK624_101300 [Phanerochaete sordida]
MLHAASGALKIAKPIAGVVPVPALGYVIDILSTLIKQVKAARTNGETEAMFFRTMNDLDEVIVQMVREANVVSGHANSMLQEQLDTLSRALGDLHAIAAKLQSGSGFCGWWKRFCHAKRNEEVLAEMIKRLADAQEIFSLGMQGAIQNAVWRIEETVKTAEWRRIIEAIPHAEAGYLCVKEIKSGFMQDSPRRLFLLTGGAGLGKSAIAHQLCLRLVDTKQWGVNLGASFFFSRGGVDSAHTLFSTIAHQLALSQPALTPSICDAARVFLTGGKEQQVRRTFEELLLKPLAGNSGHSAFNETTFVVIDGLDECKDRELVPELLHCLLVLVRRVPWLRLFLSTRPEPHILPVLMHQSAAVIVYHRRLDDSQAMGESKESVELYLRHTILKIYPYGDFVRAHPKQLDRLIERADGLFIYARVALNYLGLAVCISIGGPF